MEGIKRCTLLKRVHCEFLCLDLLGCFSISISCSLSYGRLPALTYCNARKSRHPGPTLQPPSPSLNPLPSHETTTPSRDHVPTSKCLAPNPPSHEMTTPTLNPLSTLQPPTPTLDPFPSHATTTPSRDHLPTSKCLAIDAQICVENAPTLRFPSGRQGVDGHRLHCCSAIRDKNGPKQSGSEQGPYTHTRHKKSPPPQAIAFILVSAIIERLLRRHALHSMMHSAAPSCQPRTFLSLVLLYRLYPCPLSVSIFALSLSVTVSVSVPLLYHCLPLWVCLCVCV